MLAKTISAEVNGMDVCRVDIEVAISPGLPQMTVIGLGDKTVKESGERVRSAILNSGFEFPVKKIVVNLSPAELKKRGSRFDLPIALAILQGSGQAGDFLEKSCCIGELSLDGSVKGCTGVLPIVTAMRKQGFENIFVPKENREEAALVEGARIYPVESLAEICNFLNGMDNMEFCIGDIKKVKNKNRKYVRDFSDVKGQEAAKRAIMIATAGNHGLLMTGAPGTGKTMLAERIPGIMPEMTAEEILELTSVYSIAGEYEGVMTERPFRKPGTGITECGIAGGGYPVKPGEITLAHNGVLFMDEMGEFKRRAIDSLRVPLEEKKKTLVRRGEKSVYPCDFLLIGATNPCPCGYYMHPEKKCTCTEAEIRAYRNRLSGPVHDRIDIHITLPPVKYRELTGEKGLSTEDMRERVRAAVKIEQERYRGESFRFNGDIPDSLLEKYCPLEKGLEIMLDAAYRSLAMNPRTLKKTVRIARTAADLDGSEIIREKHLAEAFQYRERGRV